MVNPQGSAVERRYVPILKAKDAEYRALADLAEPVKAPIVPLMEVPSIPWDYNAEKPAKSVDDHIKPVPDRMKRAWADRQAYVDLDLIADEKLADGRHPVEGLFGEAARLGLQLIPVAGLDRSAAYLSAIRSVCQADGRGLCLRLKLDTLAGLTETDINRFLAQMGLGPTDIDAVIDFGSVSPNQAGVLAVAASAIVTTLPKLLEWRTLTLAGTAFPQSLSGLAPDSITEIARGEWRMYQGLVATAPARVPDFGDYAIAHPEAVEMDPRIMQMSAAIRYTTQDAWLVVRGRNTRKLGWGQTRALAIMLTARPEFAGPDHCWGDGFISRRAAGKETSGAAMTWRRVGTVHHLTTVVEQLTSSPGP